QSFFLNVHVVDPHAPCEDLKHEYGFGLSEYTDSDYDAVIVSVCHDSYKHLDDSYFAGITKPNALIADLKGAFRGKIKSRNYWSF
ncbi:MAG: nucleotide sugar dehydrogenase, partial [Flavisolibacter sp.]|nr:nucleotide sugar dehydrogenase [Flavisolibacter sp.]